ncbi:MAG TPA: hypothetical protein VFJ62_17095 [Usitatibacter sp.]|nr:hypothetical protein [Usitatibacter sp.]
MLTKLQSFAAAGLAAASFISTGALAAIADPLVPLNVPVEDRTQEMWSARWWMWAASFRNGTGPISDLTGDYCNMRQEGGVFFLAGTFGSRPVHRTCTVPAGKHLFFPLVNYIVMPDGASPCEGLVSQARAITNEPGELVLEIDGTRVPGLEKRRIATECFNVNAFDRPGPKMMAASNGYWAMVKPLAPGKHTVRLGGTLPSLQQNVTYTLQVE